MPEPVTFEQIETLVVQLPAKDQLRLLAHIGERLSSTLPVMLQTESRHEHGAGDERLQLAKTLCAEVEAITNDALGEFDAAEDIHHLRTERSAQ